MVDVLSVYSCPYQEEITGGKIKEYREKERKQKIHLEREGKKKQRGQQLGKTQSGKQLKGKKKEMDERLAETHTHTAGLCLLLFTGY